MRSWITVIPDFHFDEIEIEGEKYLNYSFNYEPGNRMVCTMHAVENWNNLEVLKFAIHCRRNGIRLIMFGALNQLPLFSIFADEVILKSVPDFLKQAYDDAIDPNHITSSKRLHLPLSLQIADLSIEGWICNGERTHQVFEDAMDQVSDADVIERFGWTQIYIRQSSLDFFNCLDVPKNMIGCEIKQHSGSTAWQEKLSERCVDLRINYHRGYYKRLSQVCGEHYMAVTCLLSSMKNWMWICYGGSCNVFAFFPFKILLLSNSLVHRNLSRKLSDARWGVTGFPMFDHQQEKFFQFSDELVWRIEEFRSR